MAKIKSKTRRKSKKYKIEITSFSALLWGIFLFFLLTWIFVLGILAGRGFLPGSVKNISDFKGQVRKLQEIVSENEPYKTESPRRNDDIPKLAFYEKLASKKDEVKKIWEPEEALDIPIKGSPTVKAEGLKNLPVDEKVQNGIEMQKKTGAENLIPEIQYTVQVASIGDSNKAENIIKQLIEQGYDAYYYETNVKGKIYYRIRCGKFTNRDAASKYARKLEKETGLEGFVSRTE